MVVFAVGCQFSPCLVVISAAQAVRSQPAPACHEWKAEAAAAHRNEVDSRGCPGNIQELGNVFNPCCIVACRDF